MKKARGFFLIIALILILVISFLGVVYVRLFFGQSLSSLYLTQSDQAYYIAASGLEVARHNITVNGQSCASINGGSLYTNYTVGKGSYTVTGNLVSASTTLASAQTATATSIPLTSSNGFATQGVITINNEIMSYSGITGNTLTNVVRGLNSSTATTHASGATVTQNNCVLTATAGVPSVSTPHGGRTLSASIPLSGASFALTFGSTIASPTLTSSSNINLANSTNINNSSVTTSSPMFKGANITTSAGTPNFNNNAATSVNSASGMVTSSYSGHIENDVWSNNNNITSGNLFSYFFSGTQAQVQASANQSYTASNINGVTGKLIWTRDISLSKQTVVGSVANPVILIVNGNLTMSNQSTIYGFVYVIQGLSMHNSSSIVGAVATTNAVNLSNTATISFNSSILASAATLTNYAKFMTGAANTTGLIAVHETF